MRQRNHKSLIYCILAFFLGVFVLPALTGCSDDPEKASAKNVRAETAKALETSVKDKNYAQASEKVRKTINRNNPKGLAQASARLASGSLTLSHGRQLQSDLDLRMLPIRSTANSFEKLLRESESLLLEKERIAAILAGSETEVAELKQLLAGTDEKPGLDAQASAAKADLNALMSEKKAVDADRAKGQAVLDDYQSQSDALLRKAELAKGAEKLKLEKESFAILHDRKAYYIQVQASENKIDVLNGKIALAEMKSSGLEQSVSQSRDRINALNTSQTAAALKGQLRDIEAVLADKQSRMTSIAGDLEIGIKAYQDEAMEVCKIFENAAAEFERVNERDTKFSATLRLADSYHSAALTCSSYMIFEMGLSDRFQDLLETADEAVAASFDQKLPIEVKADATLTEKAFQYFDDAIKAYEQAFDRAGGLTAALAADDKEKGRQAKSSVLKSQLLAVDNKMILADRLDQYDMVDALTTKTDELIAKGQDFGVSFTQSETMKLIESGIDYTPSLPVNLEVYAEDLKKKLSGWKDLKITEQEAAVLENLDVIEKAVDQYGEELAGQLESVKQEMLSAQKRGFKEDSGSGSGGVSDPNGF